MYFSVQTEVKKFSQEDGPSVHKKVKVTTTKRSRSRPQKRSRSRPQKGQGHDHFSYCHRVEFFTKILEYKFCFGQINIKGATKNYPCIITKLWLDDGDT